MRARGASVTDIVILVVAADDGVMPQTKEAIARQGGEVPIIVAINKIDKPAPSPSGCGASLESRGSARRVGRRHDVRERLAVTGEGIDRLLEIGRSCRASCSSFAPIPSASASGTVLEALLDRGRGPVARVLVQDGTLRVGDFVLAGAGIRQGPRDDQRARQAADTRPRRRRPSRSSA
jgi:translation initiation factor IF-2